MNSTGDQFSHVAPLSTDTHKPTFYKSSTVLNTWTLLADDWSNKTDFTNSVLSTRWRKIKLKLNSALKKSCQTSEEQEQLGVVRVTSAARAASNNHCHYPSICWLSSTLIWYLFGHNFLKVTSSNCFSTKHLNSSFTFRNDKEKLQRSWTRQCLT